MPKPKTKKSIKREPRDDSEGGAELEVQVKTEASNEIKVELGSAYGAVRDPDSGYDSDSEPETKPNLDDSEDETKPNPSESEYEPKRRPSIPASDSEFETKPNPSDSDEAKPKRKRKRAADTNHTPKRKRTARSATDGKKWSGAELQALFTAVAAKTVPQGRFEGAVQGRTAQQCYWTWRNTLYPALMKAAGERGGGGK